MALARSMSERNLVVHDLANRELGRRGRRRLGHIVADLLHHLDEAIAILLAGYGEPRDRDAAVLADLMRIGIHLECDQRQIVRHLAPVAGIRPRELADSAVLSV